MSKTKTNKNPLITILLVIATSVFIFGFTAHPAYAQFGIPQTSFTLGDIPRKLGEIWENIKKRTGSRAFQQAIRSVSYKLAQDTALWISSGGKGKKPLIFEDFGKFARETGDVVAGKYLVNLSQGWPVDLCSPSNIRSKLSITVGLPKVLKDLEFRAGKVNKDLGAEGCKLTTMGKNFAQEAKKTNFLVKFSQDFTGVKSDLGIAAQLQEDIKKKEEQAKKEEEVKRTQTGDIKPVTDPVTDQVKTTEEQVQTATTETQKKSTADPPRTEDIFLDTLAVFANTLAKSYMAKLQSGYFPFRKTRAPDSPLASVSGADVSDKALLASFAEFAPERALQLGQSGEIDLFADMLSCPPGQYQTPYNCLLSDGLSQAVQQGLTVKQAIERKALNPEMKFPEQHQPEQAKFSFLNLRKLRFLRVLPLGWEIAAEKLEGKRPVTLKTVVDCFDKSATAPECDIDGDGQNELKGLIDPDWVLALPQQYCRAQGWIGVTAHESSPNRVQACVDLQSCVKQDPNGRCEGFGYCARERQLWQISGQACDAQYATCQNFTRPNGSAISLLGSSVDKAGCNKEQDAGCSWYSKTPSATGVTGVNAWEAASRIYLNSQSQSCRAEDAGSREIIPLEPGANLIRNSDFNPEFADKSSSDGNWSITGDAAILNDGRPGTGQISQTIQIKPHAYYTFSFFVGHRAPDAEGDSSVNIAVAAPGGAVLRKGSLAANADESASLSLIVPGANISGGLSRWAGSFYNRNAESVTITLSGNVVFDNVQLEEVGVQQGKRAEEAVAASADKSVEVLNSSPPGSVNVASPATAYHDYQDTQYNRRLVFAAAGECQADEATARAYTSTLSQETVIARLSPDGLCPKDCGGLSSFLAMPTFMDERSAQSEYKIAQVKSFVPTYSKACSASEVGCEEFTNITQKGAEQRQYFSQIRACVAEGNPKAATFYTWEGKEQAGFQLKVWRLLKDSNSNGPCATFTQGAGQDPATAACQDTGGGSAECVLNEDDNCRVFLDEGGREYRRDITKIVSVSSECTAFRRTKLAPGATEQTEQGVWHFIPSEARSCGAAAVGCREYKGARANVVTNLLFSNFESGLDNWRGGNLSEEVIAGTKSLAFQITRTGDASLSGAITKDISNALSGLSGNMLILKFLAKGAAGVTIKNAGLYAGATEFASLTGGRAVNLSADWQSYALGPVEIKSGQTESLTLRIESTGAVFIDNITLSASPDRLYLITDSWLAKQPAACSATTSDGTPLLTQCNAYADKKSNTFFVSGFDALFPEKAQYCEAVIDTQNSESPFSQTFNNTNSEILDNITVLADQFMYRYIQAANLRNKDAAGCTALGAPTLNNSGVPSSWDSTYRKLEPDNFGSTLCLAEAVGCQAFKEDDGGTAVFRDPGKKLCRFDEDAAKSNPANPFIKLNERGEPIVDQGGHAVSCNTSAGYAKLCPSDQAGCTAYAPTNSTLTEGANTTLFVKRDTVEAGSCASGEDIGLGCVEFTEGWSGGAAPNIVLPDWLSQARERVLKVNPRRECAEWLAPTTTSEVSDPASRSVRTVVYDLGRCQKLGPNGSCETWTKPEESTYPAAYGSGATLTTLNANDYANRLGGRTLYSGAWDYSGYSIPNQYPVELLTEKLDASPPALSYNNSATNSTLACRSFPEEDSPFDSSRVAGADGKFSYNDDTRHLQNVNKLEPGEPAACSYKKVVSTSEGNKYFSVTTDKTFPEDTQSITDLTGWQGYCLEWDEDTKDPATGQPLCLAWWPVDVPQAGVNIFENHPEAGFSSSGPLYYCLEAKGNKITNDTLQYVDPPKDNTYLITVAKTKIDDKKKISVPDIGYPSRLEAWLSNFYLATTTISTVSSSTTNELTTIATETKVDNDTPIMPLAPFKPDKTEYKRLDGLKGALIGFSFAGPFGAIWGGIAGFFGGAEVPKWTSVGPVAGSGLMHYRVASVSKLSQLHEYDIEAVILTARNAESASQWPANGEQLILNREGFAASPVEDAATKDRWTALWCGGRDTAKCKFGGEYTWDKFLPAIEGTACGAKDEQTVSAGGDTNLLAMRARFADENGNGGDMGTGEEGEFAPYQFLGLEGGLCDNTGDRGWTDFQISFQLREWCTAVAQVHQPGERDANKAWTGRLANRSITSFPADTKAIYNADGSPEEILGPDKFRPGYKYSQNNKPFGAIVPPPSTLYQPEEWDSRKDFMEEETVENGQLITIKKLLEPDKQPLYVEAVKGKGQIRAGSPYYCEGTTPAGVSTCQVPPPIKGAVLAPRTSDLDEALLHLKQIFAKINRVWQWAAYKVSYITKTLTDLGASQSDDLSQAVGQCPVIQAARVKDNKLLPAQGDEFGDGLKYRNRAVRGNCGSGSDAASAGRYAVNGVSINNDGLTLIESGVNQEVSLQFYTYNENGEQLPLKLIEIDWDDGTKTSAAGNYKNHRGACNNRSQNYGETDRACEARPFQFKHVYQREGKYTPIVKVTDNWGKYTRAFYNGSSDVIEVEKGSRWSPRTSASGGLQITNDPSQRISVVYDGNLTAVALAKILVVGATGAVRYTLTAQPRADWISIDPASGQLQGRHNSDTQNGDYILFITATDSASTPQSDEVALTLTAEARMRVTSNRDNGWLATYRNRQKRDGSGNWVWDANNMNAINQVERADWRVVAVNEEPSAIRYTRGALDTPPTADDTLEHHLALAAASLDGSITIGRLRDNDNKADDWHEYYTAVWEGFLTIGSGEAGSYSFELGSDDGSGLYIDGAEVVNNANDHNWNVEEGSVFLTAGEHAVKVRYFNNKDEGEVRLQWVPVGLNRQLRPVPACANIGQTQCVWHYKPFNYSISNPGEPVTQAGTVTYAITATKGQKVTRTITVTRLAGVAEPVTLSLSSADAPATLSPTDSCSTFPCQRTLTISTTNATPLGSLEITITGAPLGKTAKFTLQVNAPAVSISTFSAKPDTLAYPGGSTSLYWSAQNATGGCEIDQGLGYQGLRTGASVNVAVTTTYTLTCLGSGPPAIAKVTVTVEPQAAGPPPAAPTLVSPANGASGVSTRPDLIWTASAGEDGYYDLQISTEPSVSSPITPPSGTGGFRRGGPNRTFPWSDSQYSHVPSLAPNTIYYWRVKAGRGGDWGDWSSVRSFTTIREAP